MIVEGETVRIIKTITMITFFWVMAHIMKFTSDYTLFESFVIVVLSGIVGMLVIMGEKE